MQIEFSDLKGKEKQTLFIIGNGFDIHHGVLSKYMHFCCWLNLHGHEAFVNDMERIFPKLDRRHISLWNNFEDALGDYDLHDLYTRMHTLNNDSFNPNRWYQEARKEIGRTVEQIRPMMKEWATHINIENVKPELQLSKESYYLTFNYTKILENVYGIPPQNICHIHGSVDDEELVTGFDRTKDPDDHDAPTDEEMYVERGYLMALNKLDKYQNNPVRKNIDLPLKDISRIILIGHSLGEIDLPYLHFVRNHACPQAHWHFSKHGEWDEKQIQHFLDLSKDGKNTILPKNRWIFNF